MRYCTHCGEHIPKTAKFCAFCGEQQEELKPIRPEHQVPTEPVNPVPTAAQPIVEEAPNAAFTILESGTVFQGYTIVRMLNKDEEGFKYIAQKDGEMYMIKVFFRSRFNDLDNLFTLQMRLSRLNKLDDSHTAKVVEVNQNHDPAYMVARYVSGRSLADIKRDEPELLTESYVRDIGVQLLKTAVAIRRQELTLGKLSLHGVMIRDNGSLVVLTSAITYEESDEREDIFGIGVILAQLLSHNSLYKSIYSADRLRVQKFPYIQGVTVGLNKILAECLHRNILQRYSSIQSIISALKKIPPVSDDTIWTAKEVIVPVSTEDINDNPMPKARIEVWFWILVGIIAVLVIMLLTTNMFSIVFRGKTEPFQFTNPLASDSVKTENRAENPAFMRSGSSAQTEYGALKTTTPGANPERSTDPRILAGRPAAPAVTTPAPIRASSPASANMVYIESGSFGFGRLKENLNHNVSQSGFYISRFEVTQEEWNQYMRPAYVSTQGANLPVDNVSWLGIIIYCNGRSKAEGLDPAYKIGGNGTAQSVTCDFNANGYRLPTEAEWEMAAKAGALFDYSGSDTAEEVAWYKDNSPDRIRPGGGKRANNYGLYDMTGNVAEWCWDWFDESYTRTLQRFINPTGPDNGVEKVIRGGSVNNGEGVRLSIIGRQKGSPNRGYPFVGFRLVRAK